MCNLLTEHITVVGKQTCLECFFSHFLTSVKSVCAPLCAELSIMTHRNFNLDRTPAGVITGWTYSPLLQSWKTDRSDDSHSGRRIRILPEVCCVANCCWVEAALHTALCVCVCVCVCVCRVVQQDGQTDRRLKTVHLLLLLLLLYQHTVQKPVITTEVQTETSQIGY